MKRHVVILTEIIAPYRIPVFNALAASSDIEPHVIFLSETDPALRQWHVYKDEIRFSYEVLRGWRRYLGNYNLLLNAGLAAALRRAHPQAIVAGGYNYPAFWQAASWAKRNNVPLLLWSESNSADKRRKHPLVEILKTRFSAMCQAFIAAGISPRNYLVELGAAETSVFIAPDAVDVQLYARAAAVARAQSGEIRARHGLPPRYFLYVGRLIEEKGVFDLLAAYAKLDEAIRTQLGLVFVGDGAARRDLERRASQIHVGNVRFCGWIHREQISEFYALAEAFVFPTHSDPWGLVVNEAMSCSLPIIASDVAGCVADLVHDPENGHIFPSRDVEALTKAMQTIATQPALREPMGVRSFEIIQAHTPEACAAGFAAAINFACDGVA